MKKAKISTREILMLILLTVLVVGASYYMGFYTPLQQELNNLAEEAASIDSLITISSSQVSAMNTMQSELDEIFARPEEEITEIAPYDNKEVVFNQLNGILQLSDNYNLSFADPTVQEDGTVRRNVSMSFSCPDYASAKSILEALNDSHWRCLISNLSVSGGGNVMDGPVQISASITFFESTNLQPLVSEETAEESTEDAEAPAESEEETPAPSEN